MSQIEQLKLRYGISAILLAGIFLLGSPAVGERGASSRKNGLRFTTYGGFTFTSHTLTGMTGTAANSPGLTFGLGVDHAISDKFSIGADILYVGKSYEHKEGANIVRYKLAYLEIPFRIKYRLFPRFVIHAGPFLASIALSGQSESNGQAGSIKGSINNDYGLEVGGSLEIFAGKSITGGIEVRYDWGLADIENDGDASDGVKTRSLLSMIYCSFSF